MEIFHFQYNNNAIYRLYCDTLGINSHKIQKIADIPFLPISFFKSHLVATTSFETETVFESSGTTQTMNSRHPVKDISLYTESFNRTFEMFYGSAQNWCMLALLPSYLERKHSSLVMMADELIKKRSPSQWLLPARSRPARRHTSIPGIAKPTGVITGRNVWLTGFRGKVSNAPV